MVCISRVLATAVHKMTYLCLPPTPLPSVNVHLEFPMSKVLVISLGCHTHTGKNCSILYSDPSLAHFVLHHLCSVLFLIRSFRFKMKNVYQILPLAGTVVNGAWSDGF